MALNMTLRVTSGVAAVTEINLEYAETYQEAYDALKVLPVNRALDVDFETPEEAREFVQQGKAWAAQQVVTVDEIIDEEGNVTSARETPLVFQRKNSPEDAPDGRVTFRIYAARPPMSEEAKAKKAATREANRQAALQEAEKLQAALQEAES